MSREILINQMFAGSYLEEGRNIGHEVINLFSADDGQHYLYVTPSGQVPETHDLEAIVFVRNIEARKAMEVISVATGLERMTKEETDSIEYAGVPVTQIFRGNTYHGSKDPFEQNVTYRADNVMVPQDGRRLVLAIGDIAIDGCEIVCLDTRKKVIVSQSLRCYYAEGYDKAYDQLRQLIDDKRLWKPADENGALIPNGHIGNRQRSFLEIIRKEDDELTFSNLLAYYFEYDRDIFKLFAQDENLLNIPNTDYAFEIVRESNWNIDLWIESENHIIVIENKIKSGVNGIKSKEFSQLNKYHEAAKAYASKVGKQAWFYVFVPDYNAIDLAPFGMEEAYKTIRYSEIYEHFTRNAVAFLDDKYFADFVIGLRRHAMTLAELNYDTMRTRFLEKIWQAQ